MTTPDPAALIATMGVRARGAAAALAGTATGIKRDALRAAAAAIRADGDPASVESILNF